MGRLFGTDGVRGVANEDLTCERAMQIGRAAAYVLAQGLGHRPLFLLGEDPRMSSGMLVAALAAGITSAGADVKLLGVVPTPAVSLLTRRYGADAGVMVSASHNSFEYNGIKIFNGEGYKLPDAIEDEIETLILDDHLASVPGATGSAVGVVKRAQNALEDYIGYLLSTTDVSLEGLRLVIDCANGSSAVTAERVFTGLGATVVMMANAPDGQNINRDCGSLHMEALREEVLARSFDCGLAFDGDADRFLAVDERGNIVDGDRVLAILAPAMAARGKLPEHTVVGTVMTNFGFKKFCEREGLRFIATKVGDRYVLEEMLLGGYTLGGEQSGHIIFTEFATTGDGQLTAIQLLSHMCRSGKSLSELASCMTQYPQYMTNLRVSPAGKLLFYTDAAVKEAIESAAARLGDSGRILVRPSGTEPLIRVMAEGEDEDLIRDVVEEVADLIKSRLGEK